MEVWMCGCVDVWIHTFTPLAAYFPMILTEVVWMCGCVDVWMCGCVDVWMC